MSGTAAVGASKSRLLLVSGGSLIGQNILDALWSRRDLVELVAINSVAHGSSLFEFDRVYLAPPTLAQPDLFESRLCEILEEERPDLVIPCRDDDVVFLADLKARQPDTGARFLCGNLETAQIANDKWLSSQFSVANGLPFAPTLLTPAHDGLEAFVQEHGFPLLAKPRNGFGAHGIRLITNPDQLRHAAAREGYVIQTYLNDATVLHRYLREAEDLGTPLFHSFEGLKHSIQILIAPDGSLAGNFCSCNVNRFGTSMRLERYRGTDAMELGEACGAAFSRAGWRGPMNIQCQQVPDGRLVIYEFNSRISGATAARYRMGHDELGSVIKHFTGRALPFGGATNSDLVIRRAIDVAIDDRQSEALAKSGVWRRDGPMCAAGS
jgi:carbamoyl-phosphate synthase large subunit